MRQYQTDEASYRNINTPQFSANCVLPRLRCHPEVPSDHPKSNAHDVFPDHNYRVWVLVPDGNGLIIGHLRMGMVWAEVTSGWKWSDQRSLPDGNGLIRGHFRSRDDMIRGRFRMEMVWSEVASGWERYDQRYQISVWNFLNFFPRQAIAKILFVLDSRYTGDTPYRFWFHLDNYLTRFLKFNICNLK